MNDLQEKYKDVVDFLAVYILEAHAKDVWPLGTKICFNEPKTIEERLQIANNFATDYNFQIPILVDDMDNNFNGKYAAWPERYYIIQDEKMKLIAEPSTEYGYNRAEIKTWIDLNLINSQTPQI